MSNFFDKFPKVPYNISGERLGNYQAVTNIMFRFGFLRDVINNASAYESYTIQEGDTPEILAHKYMVALKPTGSFFMLMTYMTLNMIGH